MAGQIPASDSSRRLLLKLLQRYKLCFFSLKTEVRIIRYPLACDEQKEILSCKPNKAEQLCVSDDGVDLNHIRLLCRRSSAGSMSQLQWVLNPCKSPYPQKLVVLFHDASAFLLLGPAGAEGKDAESNSKRFFTEILFQCWKPAPEHYHVSLESICVW